MSPLPKAVLAITLAGLAGLAFHEARQAADARADASLAQQQQTLLSRRLEQLQTERDDARNRLAALAGQKRNDSELLKLRGEVTRLRGESQELARLRAASPSKANGSGGGGGFIPKAQLANAGFASPEAALLSFMAAVSSGDYEQVKAAMAAHDDPKDAANDADKERQGYEEMFQKQSASFKGIQMLAKKTVSDDQVDIQVLVLLEGEPPSIGIQRVVRSGTDWKFAGSYGGDIWSGDGQVQWLTGAP